jgi:hypothetical protein
MPSWVACDNGHWGGYCRHAAIELSKNGNLQPCENCGAQRHYFVSQTYANIDETHEYELVRVARLYSDEDSEKSGYDPMIFLLLHKETGEKAIWPFYWGKDRKGRWRVGQFPPLFSVGEMEKLLQSLNVL